ncbi:hypothetical protein A2634_00025 [Candidatus Amesbacteria bacterium RIFCSPHIGHO2_01_FULL_48_32]|uniref:histidine kinase n=1 Tax=Candidatus Amesbacteria bacterium RIFCSPLOWO2_01_FULL_48_25 TaxID=1797259 RepID=A0A1F4ZCK3_9BACT|nr:MAG: hypothetical protein A2634_00025 [Candidatus Amesbacteria bacterium RIFCSPHIGHO2_01_FULL_48_32]OGD03144.1 MAG: hypothetical protein A2989_02295 [Candidatus Amesbacteria bacterium RIFCSPLOWO2_01_FULL_48_25]
MLISCLVSVLFSYVIYVGVNRELVRFERLQRVRLQEWGWLGPEPDLEIVNHARYRLVVVLGIITAGISALAGIAGYVLAGQTLAPLEDMVERERRFVADASHELRTPLTSLKSETEVALRDKKLDLTDARRLMASNLEEINRLQDLSDNLIKLSRLQGATDAVPLEQIEAAMVVGEAVKKVAGIAAAKEIKISSDIKNIKLEADKSGLVELLVILLDNAIKYSLAKSEVTVRAYKTNGQGVWEVRDRGVGIAQRDLGHVFERFYRGDKSRTKSEAHGYGLGLAIASEIVAKHGGTIGVKSQVGRGSTFTVRLPVKH